MSGCSLQEAFPDTAKQGPIARKEERQKAKKCGGPALAFLKAASDLDPDRQAQRPLPPPDKLEGREGFQNKQGFDVQDLDRDLIKNLSGEQVDDVIGERNRKTLPRAAESSGSSGSQGSQGSQASPAQTLDFKKTMYGDPVPSYFGKSANDGFADYSTSMTDNPGYSVQGSMFSPSTTPSLGLDKAAGSLSLPTPSITDAWKPMTSSGSRTSYFENTMPLEDNQGTNGANGKYASFSNDEKQSLLQKLDTLFARLEELESKTNEYAHAEISLFILSGLFLMFGLETARKFR